MTEAAFNHESRLVRIAARAVLSFGAGLLLTFVVPMVLNALDGILTIDQRSGFLWSLLVRALNLPAVIYCAFFKLPESLPKSDESMYCWAMGFYFNIFYYSLVIYLLALVIERWRKARRQAKQQSEKATR